MIRRAVVKYYNAGETTAQHTDRSVRSLVKLFNVDEGGWMEDMERIRKICEDTGLDLSVQPTPPAKPQRDPMGSTCKSCCFAFHATLCAHTSRPARIRLHTSHTWDTMPITDLHARKKVLAYFFESLGDDHMIRLFKPSDPFVNSLLITLTMGASTTMGPMPVFHIGNDHLSRYVPFAEWMPFHYGMDRNGVPLKSFWCYKRFFAYPYIRANRQVVDTYIGDLHHRMQAQPDHTHLAHLETAPEGA